MTLSFHNSVEINYINPHLLAYIYPLVCYIIHVPLVKSLLTLILVTEANGKIWVYQPAMIRGHFPLLLQ